MSTYRQIATHEDDDAAAGRRLSVNGGDGMLDLLERQGLCGREKK